MQYTWTEKGTRFNGKDYHFTMWYDEEYNEVAVSCTYGRYTTSVLFSPDEEQYIHESLDEMKELLYNKSYN